MGLLFVCIHQLCFFGKLGWRFCFERQFGNRPREFEKRLVGFLSYLRCFLEGLTPLLFLLRLQKGIYQSENEKRPRFLQAFFERCVCLSLVFFCSLNLLEAFCNMFHKRAKDHLQPNVPSAKD